MSFVKVCAVIAAVVTLCAPGSVSASEKAGSGDLLGPDVAAERTKNSPWRMLFSPRPKAKPKAVSVSYTKGWLDAQPKATGGDDLRCLSEALYFEARGESVRGQFAVAEVIMNRVKSGRFPDTVCGVINQGTGRKYQCQFTYTCDGIAEVIREPKAYERVSKVARAVLDGSGAPLTSGATHYHTTAVRPSWSRVYRHTASIGVHRFYRHNYRTASN
ncbi:MAG: cell wall hydrolase [Marinibacterium sp.]|nr:cell wall hydrolase [Marinibacterium sp.]